MNTDFAFIATPAKCRLLLALQQYKNMDFALPPEIIEIAKKDLLVDIDGIDIEHQQALQFLSDVGKRATIVKNKLNKNLLTMDVIFLIHAAQMLGHKDFIVFAQNEIKCQTLLKQNHIGATVFNPMNFFLNDQFQENMVKYENHLVIVYLDDTLLETRSDIEPFFRHFEKIWVMLETYGHMTIKNMATTSMKIVFNNSPVPTLYNGMLELNKEICYFPKLKFPA
jgi:hypothetical protein